MGGSSAEHEVSLATGQNVLDNLDLKKYRPLTIKISKTGKWFVNNRIANWSKAVKNCDVVFNALHGSFGEDGKVQAILESAGKRYAGSGIAASALAMDKFQSREIFKLAGLNVPKTFKLKKGENFSAQLNFFVNKIAKFPVVVKPCSNGSSIGVQIADNSKKLAKAVVGAFLIDKEILVEEFIKGRELTCGVLSSVSGSVDALPVTEIVPLKKHQFFNYDAKYKAGHSNEITPAQLGETVFKQAQDTAVRAHQILNCRGYSRTDMILTGAAIYVLEINTLPGLTPNSLLPKAAQSAGLSFPQLIDKIIETALLS
ncbi:MAG: D-alanine-D-alanine ligase [Candidatus Yanofskybacteria bacterium GW2011_GWC2_41_9]|uniref:D-alanine--D-alanine ligase n=1 Tax=Candidatus Yanofskybacteria bacterium GW2011_GWC2_41_9 TaxID=1619029 RepID=A0A0G0XQF3_9BACT|nr:MAG: D-alanine-D-alanine ligase [Candidatus Yanofskybacteria bacterium GW2011_GWC2_41_9]